LPVRTIRRTILLLAAANAALVMVYASHQYGWMVDNIEGMQVFMGHWINRTLPENSLIAINDVGAIAYYGDREDHRHGRVDDAGGHPLPEAARAQAGTPTCCSTCACAGPIT